MYTSALAMLLAIAVGAEGQPPSLLNIGVGLVRVTPTRPGTDKPWSIPGTKPKSDCNALAAVAGLATGGTASVVVKFLCASSSGQANAEKHSSTAPDIYVRVGLGRGPTLRSYTVEKSLSHSFSFHAIVPTAAVPTSGLTVQVVDDDGSPNEETKEVIGSVRLTPTVLLEAVKKGTVITQSDGGVEKLEITVEPSQGAPRSKTQPLDVSQGITNLPDLPVAAGEVVEVQALGEYRMRGHSELVTPAGLPPGVSTKTNFPDEPFRSGPHAAGLVRVGKAGAFKGFLVTPCASFVSPYDGLLSLGINETQQASVTGDVTFDVKVRPATVAELNGSAPTCATGAAPARAAGDTGWATAHAGSVAHSLKERGDGLAAEIVRLTHPSGKAPTLLDVQATAGDESVSAVVTVVWHGGLTNGLYRTTVRWEFNSRRHIKAAVVSDTAVVVVAPKNATMLDDFFKSEIYPAIDQ